MLRAALLAALLATSSALAALPALRTSPALAALPALRTSPAHTPHCRRCAHPQRTHRAAA
jgi:hypothetical protein